MRERRGFIAWAAAALCTTMAAALAAPAAAPVAPEIESIVRERIAAASRGDRAAWRRNVADDAVWVGPGLANAGTAAAELAITANASLPKQAVEIRDFEVHEFGEAALATYVLLGGTEGDTATKRFRKADTYVRREGRWQLVSAVEILVPTQAAAQADAGTYDALAGQYRLDVTHVVRVWRDGDRLLSQADGEERPTELLPAARDIFFVDGDPGEYRFGRDASGTVDRLEFRMPGSADVVLVRVGAQSGLVGAWRLVSYEDKPPAGPSLFPFGQRPNGLLLYDTAGRMSIQIMKVPHPKVASGDDSLVTPEEKQALYDAYVAYFGTYSVDVARGVVVHHVEGDLADVYVGQDQERPFVLQGDTLTLTPRWQQDDSEWHGIRIFERMR